jgi:hypothetical protein
MKNIITTVGIVYGVLALSVAVGLAATQGVLIPAAIPFAVILIIVLRLTLGRRAELIAWATLAAWLGSTYLMTGAASEIVAFLVIVVLAAFGLFRSPYILAAVWLLHPLWDFLPRTLPNRMADLPIACLLFDIPIGLYLLRGARLKTWLPICADEVDPVESGSAVKRVGRSVYVLVALVVLSVAVTAAASANWLLLSALPMSIILIAGLRPLGPKAELIAWAVFTGWFGMTYAHAGGTLEIAVFMGFVVLAAVAVFRAPIVLAGAWLLSVPWNFLPHQLAQTYPALPMACVIFAIPIALYLGWGARAKRWEPFDEPAPVLA